jgi:hypothetical protein
MAISKKNKRPLTYDGKPLLWWVNPEFDGDGGMLSVTIASEDGKFLIKHFIVQHTPNESYLIVQKVNPIRVPCPSFRDSLHDNAVTPRTVKDILDWFFANEHPLTDQKSSH